MNLPKISIIVPIYNTELKYVSECLKSISNQTYPKDNLEIVVCIDGQENEYVDKLNSEFDRIDKLISINLIQNERQEGLSKSRNKAIAYSEGDWLFILDSDDVIDKTAIQTLANRIEPEASMIYSDHAKMSHDLTKIYYIRNKSAYHKLIKIYDEQPLYNPMYSSVYISHGELIRRDKFMEIGGYKKIIGEKPPIWINFIERFGINSLIHVPEILYFYRENKNGIATKRKDELIKAHEETFLESMKRFDDEISSIKYLGRIGPFMAKHFTFFDKNDEMIVMPYIDYGELTIIKS